MVDTSTRAGRLISSGTASPTGTPWTIGDNSSDTTDTALNGMTSSGDWYVVVWRLDASTTYVPYTIGTDEFTITNQSGKTVKYYVFRS